MVLEKVVRNVASGFNISGYDNNAVSLQTNTVVIQDNLMYDISTALGGELALRAGEGAGRRLTGSGKSL